jgi:hypothetical protein
MKRNFKILTYALLPWSKKEKRQKIDAQGLLDTYPPGMN